MKREVQPTITLDRSKDILDVTNYIAVWVWIGWICFYFFLMISFPLMIMFTPVTLLVIIGVILLSAFYPIDKDKQPQWGVNLGIWAMKKAASYFHIKMVVEDLDAIKKAGPSVFAMEPHDVLPIGVFSFDPCLNSMPGHNCVSCVTSACFSIPIIRHVYTWANCTSVDKKGMINLLGTGHSPVLIPGGVAEVCYLGNDSECVLYLKERMGFIKVAMLFGAPVIPVFAFGLRESFDCWVPKAEWIHRIGRMIGFLPMCFFGAFGLPFGPAKPSHYVNVVGSPIPLPKLESPTPDEVKKYHSMYMSAITDIFERNKVAYGMGHVTLRIV